MTDIDLKRLAVDREYWDEVTPTGSEYYSPSNDTYYMFCQLTGMKWRQCAPGCYSWEDKNPVYQVPPNSIHRPPKKAHDGEWHDGLPPVGVECEFIHPGITSEGWQIGTIKAYFDDRVAIKSNPSIWPACGYAVILIDEELKFRSLKPKHERQRAELAELVLSGMKDCEYYPYETDVNSIADAILSKYNLEPKP